MVLAGPGGGQSDVANGLPILDLTERAEGLYERGRRQVARDLRAEMTSSRVMWR